MAYSINRVELLGDVSDEIKYSDDGKTCNFRVKVSESVYNKETKKSTWFSTWVNVSAQGWFAESCRKNGLAPKQKVLIVGKISNFSYTDKSGNKLTFTSVAVSGFEATLDIITAPQAQQEQPSITPPPTQPKPAPQVDVDYDDMPF